MTQFFLIKYALLDSVCKQHAALVTTMIHSNLPKLNTVRTTMQVKQFHSSCLVYSDIFKQTFDKYNCDISWTDLKDDDYKKYKYWEFARDENNDNVPTEESGNYKEIEFAESKTKICSEMSRTLKPHDPIVVNLEILNDKNTKHGHDTPSDWGETFQGHNTQNSQFTHIDTTGKLNMVDISNKSESTRVAIATGIITLGQNAFYLVKENKAKKGDVLTVAQLAGISGAKRTSDLIPLCHNIPLSKVSVDFELDEENFSIRVTALAKTHGKTGVEMEAITAVAMATVTIYDMCKAVTKDMVISDIRLNYKSGGHSGEYKVGKT